MWDDVRESGGFLASPCKKRYVSLKIGAIGSFTQKMPQEPHKHGVSCEPISKNNRLSAGAIGSAIGGDV
jgi:hypothetical protein